jgi:hypothetical protein
VTRARTLWEEGTDPGRQVVALGVAATLTAVVLDLLANGGLTLVFDLVFVLLCPALALLVRPRDFFTVGVLPPLLMLGAVWALAVRDTDLVAHSSDSTVQAVVTGLASHATALVLGYGICLAFLAIRHRVITARKQGAGVGVPRQRVSPREAQASNRSASPAPRRTTSGAPLE